LRSGDGNAGGSEYGGSLLDATASGFYIAKQLRRFAFHPEEALPWLYQDLALEY
jgi:hypothetical protein